VVPGIGYTQIRVGSSCDGLTGGRPPLEARMSRTPLCYSRTTTRTFGVCWLRSTLASEKRLGQGQHGQQSHRAADRAYREKNRAGSRRPAPRLAARSCRSSAPGWNQFAAECPAIPRRLVRRRRRSTRSSPDVNAQPDTNVPASAPPQQLGPRLAASLLGKRGTHHVDTSQPALGGARPPPRHLVS
jgi:hypothetical protein